ncbi:PIG-L deacetylase family protein [Raineyella fluvialis]|uniref:PIG-L family deacetylase n=1 Tax=Raineyella fluvialis TaxID=2662261 RepID=A0A5Q2F622_9ACTN|nr:PIG-L deacetylase family protein [Raineyella fluvialis]QGF22410.1 PIG-L family deacetylase [Raineyella fluvialis]
MPTSSVLAIVAHPDDESFGLGAVLDTLVSGGAEGGVLCYTRGEASTLHGVEGDLTELRVGELTAAAEKLGLTHVRLCEYPDGDLASIDRTELAAVAVEQARAQRADLVLVLDESGITGHPDHRAATAAGLAAADELGLPVLAWTLSPPIADALNAEFPAGFIGTEGDEVWQVSREHQVEAAKAHASQALPTSVLWRRLKLMGDEEHVRWLRRAAR